MFQKNKNKKWQPAVWRRIIANSMFCSIAFTKIYKIVVGA